MINPNVIIDIPYSAKRIISYLCDNGNRSYVVGGCVRDSLLDRIPHDWDICTSARPDRVREILRRNCISTVDTGLKHGTVTACMPDGNYEVTTFRIDGTYSDNRRPDKVKFVDGVLEDLSRRDFTINAMAYGDALGVIDPFDGYSDIKLGLIRCVGNPDDRFQEDALRILRALRFAATYGFRIEEKTADAIHRNKDLLKNISAERIQSELCKMLCGEGVLDILLNYSDVMAVIIPEFEPCIGFNQNNPYHKYTVYDHIAHAVAAYRDNNLDLSIRLALLLHDIGKPECYTEDENGVGHFYEHGIASARIAENVLRRLKFDNKTSDEVVTLVLYHDADVHPKARSVRRWLNKIGPNMLDKLLRVRCADIDAQGGDDKFNRLVQCAKVDAVLYNVLVQQQCFQIKDLAVGGRDILALGVEAGPKVGEVLNHLLNKVIEEEIENNHDALLEWANRYLRGE